jgi:AraC-like DNA-binding protein
MIQFDKTAAYIEDIHNNTEFKPHFHQSYSFALITNGSCIVEFKNRTVTYAKNDFRIVNPNEIHYVKSGIWEYKSIVFEKEFVNKITFEIAMQKDLTFQNKITSQAINRLFCKMYNKNEEAIYFFFEKLISYTQQIELPDIKLKKSIQLINENFTQKLDLETLAKSEDLSKYHFLRLFKNQLGLTPHQYIMVKRLNYALELMKKENNLSIVAVSAGFSDQSHFIKEFKKVFGFTPKH